MGMAETTEEPTGEAAQRPAVPRAGLGMGPMIAAGVMFAGGVIAGGFGVGTMLFGGDEAQAETGDGTTVSQPAEQTPGQGEDTKESSTGEPSDSGGSQSQGKPGEVTVTLPDRDGNGIADALEDEGESPGDDPHEGKPDEDLTSGDESKDYVYIIESGDTLVDISAETGVPVGTLVEDNDIADPNLIYAGAALLIAPTS